MSKQPPLTGTVVGVLDTENPTTYGFGIAPTSLDEAEYVTSATDETKTKHKIMLDLDIPAKLVPSSTLGNSHLYIDVTVDWDQYERLLILLGELGILEDGYVAACLDQQYSTLRLPWVKKPGTESPF